MVVSIDTADHYVWAEICDGWNLLKRDDISVIQERVPSGASEVMHYHAKSRQFFYILQGEGVMDFGDHVVVLKKGQGIEIPPEVKHQFRNQSNADVHFLVISMPSTNGDRVNIST